MERRQVDVVHECNVSLDATVVAQWTVGSNSFEAAEKAAAERLEEYLSLVRAAANIGEDRFRKLELAGRGDISRFFASCRAVYHEHAERELDWDELQRLGPRCDALRKQFKDGLHVDDESLFNKLLVSHVGADLAGHLEAAHVAATTNNLQLKMINGADRAVVIQPRAMR